MRRFESSRKNFRVLVVTTAVITTLARPVFVSPCPESRHAQSSVSSLHSDVVASNVVADDFKTSQEYMSPTEGDTRKESTLDGVANTDTSSLLPSRGFQLMCRSFPGKPSCRNVVTNSLKYKGVDKGRAYQRSGQALVGSLTDVSSKDQNHHKQVESAVLQPGVWTRDHVDWLEIRLDKQNDHESDDVLSRKGTSTEMKHHVGKRHARNRFFGNRNIDKKSRPSPVNMWETNPHGIDMSHLRRTLLPFQLEHRQNDYIVVKLNPAVQDDRSLPTGNAPPVRVWTRLASSYNPFDSAEFRKFQNHIENVIRVPIRIGYTRFASSKPTGVPVLDLQGPFGRSRHGKVPGESGEELAREVCPSVSDWVCLSYAQDNYGSTLKVLDTIEYNGTIVRQYFYETSCAFNHTTAAGFTQLDPELSEKNDVDVGDGHECLAVDKEMWHSLCRERLILTYGLVVKVNGDVGWGVIAIRGSCNCSVWHPKST